MTKYRRIIAIMSFAFISHRIEPGLSLPFVERILVLAPHPDDDILGCGGSLRQYVIGGTHCKIAYLTSGDAAPWKGAPAELATIREKEAQEGAAILGISDLEFLREPDGKLAITENLTQRIQDLLLSYNPQLIFIPHEADGHADHKATFAIVTNALKGAASNKDCYKLPQVLCYEVWTPLQKITHTSNISAHIALKLEALSKHRSQIEVLDYTRAIEGLGRYRGIMACQSSYGECFCEWVLTR